MRKVRLPEEYMACRRKLHEFVGAYGRGTGCPDGQNEDKDEDEDEAE
jgi:hypothetical protein